MNTSKEVLEIMSLCASGVSVENTRAAETHFGSAARTYCEAFEKVFMKRLGRGMN